MSRHLQTLAGTYSRAEQTSKSTYIGPPTCNMYSLTVLIRDMSGVRRAGGSSSVAQAEQYDGTASCCLCSTDTTRRGHKSATKPRHPIAGPSCRVSFQWLLRLILQQVKGRRGVFIWAKGTARWVCLCPSPSPSPSSSIMMIGLCFFMVPVVNVVP